MKNLPFTKQLLRKYFVIKSQFIEPEFLQGVDQDEYEEECEKGDHWEYWFEREGKHFTKKEANK